MNRTVVDTRSELLSLLSEACELEHALACAYLFAAFSLKTDLEEGITWEQQQRTRRWAAQLYFVASQEMLHLAQAWNLLTAIGGTPYYDRPAYPIPPSTITLGVGIPLERYGASSLSRFVAFEKPQEGEPDVAPARRPQPDEIFRYTSVAELYALIASGFDHLPARELFVGDVASQADARLAHFPDIVVVSDAASAHRAVHVVQLQGEGSPAHREDSHHGMFTALLREWRGVPDADELVRPVARTPVRSSRRGEVRAAGGVVFGGMPIAAPESAERTPLSTAASNELAALFDDVYVLMFRMLAFGWTAESPGDPTVRARRAALVRYAIELMVGVLKPLGEALALTPVGDERAGATFHLTRHVLLPTSSVAACRLTVERLRELAGRAARLADGENAVAAWGTRVRMTAASLERIAGAVGGT